MATTENDIFLKLVIQGQSPDELRRLASQTQGQLNNEMKVLLDQLTRLHRDAAQQQTDEDKAKTKKMMDNAEKQLSVVNQVLKANEAAAAKTAAANKEAADASASAWRKTTEATANLTISLRGMYDAVTGGLSRLKSLGDEVDRLTNVYGSLKGSINEMREASRGEISDYDLITTKNRALEKDLQLTDAQFGAVAASADKFADAIGTNTADALNQIVDGLATGRVKMLEHAGIVVNVEQAYANYAKSIGVAADQLNEHGKKIATVRAALRAMDEKLAGTGQATDDFSHRYEKMTAEIKNATDKLLLFLGEIGVAIFEMFETKIPRGIRHAVASINDVADLLNPLTGFKQGHRLQDEKAFDAIEDRNRAAERNRNAEAARARLAAGTSYDYQQGTRADSINQTKLASDARRSAEARARAEKGSHVLDDLFLKVNGPATGSLDAGFRSEAPGGLTGSLARTEALRAAQQRMAEESEKDAERQNQQAAEAMAKLNEDTIQEMRDKADKLRERAGGGIFATILFGPSGKDELLDNIDSFKNSAADAMGMVSDTANKMAEALGASLAAFVSGDKNKRKSIRDTTHDILEALAAQAYTRAIFETAEGLASLALGPVGGASAAAHFAAAGMFGAVGTAAGLSARAVGQSAQPAGATKAAGSSTGGGYSSVGSSGGSSFGSGGMRSSGGSEGGGGAVNIVINAPLGDRAEIGYGVNLALEAYFARSGRGVQLPWGTA